MVEGPSPLENGAQVVTPSVGGILRKIGVYGVGSMFSQGVAYVALLVYASLLPVDEFGVLAIALVVFSVTTTLCHLNLPGTRSIDLRESS
jgi:O-antigen/teichoic acid export membrane protein